MPFNPAASYSQGFAQAAEQRERAFQKSEEGRLKRQRESFFNSKEKGEAFKRLLVDQPTFAVAIKKELNTDEKGIEALIEDSVMIKHQLEIDPSGAGAMQLLQSRKQAIDNNPFLLDQGKNSFHTDKAISVLQNKGPEALLANMNKMLDLPQQLKQRISGGKDSRTATQKDFATFQDLLMKAKESGSEKDKKKAESYGRAARFIRETEQEKADIKVSQKERETIAKANIGRKQGFIDSGVEAANGAGNIRRALDLLDEVDTGGFDNLALKAKRLFGVEGANEGELSNLMGKAVLAQLKPIFGAAFTAREGDALAELEAKFSNSSKSNKRLLENALKIIDRSARRGIAAAENQGDDFTANEIRESLAFKLENKIIQDEQQLSAPAQKRTDGKIMVDANGNRALVYPDGTFEEL